MTRHVDMRSRLGVPRSQGLRSTCLAFATSAAHEVALFDEHDILDTCEEYLYWASKQHDDPGPGTTFPAVRDGLAVEGQPLEEQWPYDEERDDDCPEYQPPPEAHTAQPRWSPTFSEVPATPKSLRTELDAGRAVVLGLPTWPAFDRPSAGRLAVPAATELDGAHHAVAVIGYDETTTEMLIRNSWGPTWGEAGTAWLPLSFLDEHECETWVVNSATVAVTSSSSNVSRARYGSTERTGSDGTRELPARRTGD
jgi:C1A family cysteine protease